MDAIVIVIFLVFSFGSGFYIRGLREKKSKLVFVRCIGAKEKEIAELKAKAEHARIAGEKRRQNAMERRRAEEAKDVRKVKNQIQFVSQINLKPKNPMTKESLRVIYAIEALINYYYTGWRVAFEVSMGSFIKTVGKTGGEEQDLAYGSYGSKRVDFLLIDNFGNPRLVVEYNGTGHDLSPDAPDRMRVKQIALERAGIPLLEISSGATKADIMHMIRQRLPASAPA